MKSNYNRKIEFLIYWLGNGDELDHSRIERLTSNGLTVKAATSEGELRQLIDDEPPHLLVIANYRDIQTNLDCGLTIKSEGEHSELSFMLITELLDKETKEYFYQSGGNELILEPASLIEIFFRIASLKLAFDKSNSAEIQIEEASQMALLAMENSSDLGSTINFVKSAARCRDYQSLAACILEAVRVYSDSAILELKGAESDYYFGSGEQVDPDLKKLLLTHKNDQTRIVRFDNAFQMNHDNLTLLAEGLPIDDVARMGRIADNLVILTDTADRFASELLLQEKSIASEVQKRRFISTISHELNTPMNAIQGFSKMFADRGEEEQLGKKGVKALTSIHQNATRIKSIIETLIDITSDENDLGKTKMEEIDLNLLIQGLKVRFSQAINDKGLSLLLPDNIEIKMNGDRNHLEKMLAHLLDNAIKFTDSGEVELSLNLINPSMDNEQVRITVRDTGIGIDEENMSRLFNRLGQLNISHDRTHYGAGLGLYYVQSFAKQLNGSVDVCSEKNNGSEFHLTLPSNVVKILDDTELF